MQLDQLFPEEISASHELLLMGQGFPLSREVCALIQERLMAAGAKLVVFDLVFPQPDRATMLFETLERYRGQVVLACDFLIDRVEDGMRYSIHVPVSTLVERTEPLDQRLGFDTLFPDADGVLRRVPFVTTLRELDGFRPAPEDERYESVTARSLRQLGRGRPHPTSRQRQHLFRYAGPPSITMPLPLFPEITLPAPATAPPMVFTPLIRLTPDAEFGSRTVPFTSRPMMLPCTVAPELETEMP